jgi:hypothetical protein
LLVALLVGISVLASQSQQTTAVHAWTIGLAIIALLVIILTTRLYVLSTRDRPRLELGDSSFDLVGIYETLANGGANISISGTHAPPDDDDVFLVTEAAGPTGPTGAPGLARGGQRFFATRLPVFNRPRVGNALAKDVHVRLRYFSGSETTPIREVSAKWTFSPQDVLFESTQIASQVDIPANEAEFNFDVLAKFENDDQIFGIDDESRFRGWKANPLGTGPIRVEVTILSSNCQTVIRGYETQGVGPAEGVQLIAIPTSTTQPFQ